MITLQYTYVWTHGADRARTYNYVTDKSLESYNGVKLVKFSIIIFMLLASAKKYILSPSIEASIFF